MTGARGLPSLGGMFFIVDDNEEQRRCWHGRRPREKNFGERSVRRQQATPRLGECTTDRTCHTRYRYESVYSLEGELLYEFGGNSSITIATPYAKDDLLYVSSGYADPKPLFAIKPGASGDITLGDQETSNISFMVLKEAAPYNPSTLLYEGRIYVLTEDSCLL